MTTVYILEALKDFLKENVCSFIKLQKPSDNNVNKYELVNPQAHVMYIPQKGYLPQEIEPSIPCLIVSLDEGTDDGQEASMNIRIVAVVYSPGLHQPNVNDPQKIDYTPDFNGWNDLFNLIDRTIAELQKNQIINDVTTIQPPIKWGPYKEQPYPYFYGWITFSVNKQSYPKAKIAEKYL